MSTSSTAAAATTKTTPTTTTTKNKPKIVITGFDKFRDYKVNPSWEAVRSLKWQNDKYDLIKIKVPVTYEDAKSNVSQIWKHRKPELVIHVGVSHLANCLTLEECAVVNKQRYISPDVNNVCLSPAINPDDQLVHLKTGLNIDQIVKRINNLNASGNLPITAVKSTKAGEYLCEYIYRCSLKKNNQRSLFVHVPQLSSTVTPELLGKGLNAIIEIIIELYL